MLLLHTQPRAIWHERGSTLDTQTLQHGMNGTCKVPDKFRPTTTECIHANS